VELHQTWASRRAWRVRARLLGLLALIALLLYPWTGGWILLLPLLSLLYPSKREEARALAEIDRKLGLVYRTALETPRKDPVYDRLWNEATQALKVAKLPPFPWWELTVALTIWLAAATTAPPIKPSGFLDNHLTFSEENEPAATRSKKDGVREKSNAGPTPAPDANTTADEQQLGSPNDESELGGKKTQPPSYDKPGEMSKDLNKKENVGRPDGQTKQGKRKQAESPLTSKPFNRGRALGKESSGDSPGGDEEISNTEETPGSLNLPSSKRDIPSLANLPPPDPHYLPNPWNSGSPPKEVQRAAERYIKNNPLPPGAAEAIKRYFELTGN